MNRPYDAVVVGAGPAGSATARDIAKAGYRVLLLEEHNGVGRPLHCSGLVTPRTLELAKVGGKVVVNEIRGALIYPPSGSPLSIGGDGVRALAVDRTRFDEALSAQAQSAGAELLLSTRFAAFERKDGLVQVYAERRGEQASFSTKILIGADGAQSKVARQLGVHSLRGTVWGLSAEVRVKEAPADHVILFMDNTLAPGWFAWMIPLGDGRARVGLGGVKRVKPAESLGLLADRFPAYFHNGEPMGFTAASMPLWRPLRPYSDNVLLVGDAARQVKPTSGGGIYVGLVGARHAARSAILALEREDFSKSFLSRYNKSFMADLGGELKRGSDLHRLFATLTNKQLDKLLTRLRSDRLQRIILSHGNIDFPSGLVYELFKAAPSLATFVRVPPRFPAAWLPCRRRRKA